MTSQALVTLQQYNADEAQTCLSAGVETQGHNLFLPRPNWSAPQPIHQCGRLPLDSSVTVVDLGHDLPLLLRRQLPQLLKPTQTTDQSRSNILDAFTASVVPRLKTQGIETQSIRVSNVAINPPGVPSTGRDFVENIYVGLHIDDHDKLPLRQRAGAIQLLAVNCSKEDRFFHFIDVPVNAMAQMTNTPLDGEGDPQRASDLLKNNFLNTYPDYPITRIILPPGYAYIATPQNIIHDGAAGSQVSADVAFLMLGRYSWAA